MEQAKNDPLLIVHTSGTSGMLYAVCSTFMDGLILCIGLPKAITYTVALQSAMDKYRGLSERSSPDEKIAFDLFRGRRFLHTLTLAWAAGLQFVTDLAIYWEAIPILMPSEAPQPISIKLIHETLHLADFEAALLLPFLLREISKRPQVLQTMKAKGLSMVGYLGAPLDRAPGDVYAEFTEVQEFVGSTEVGPMPIMVTEQSDWLSYRFHPRSGCQMELWYGSADTDMELYELVFNRHFDVAGSMYIFEAQPELQIFRSNDLYIKHPENPDQWIFQVRADDLVKNFNLTKFNAKQIEAMAEQDPRIRAALMGGDGQKNTFLLLEMNGTNVEDQKSRVLDQIWPLVTKVNEIISEEIRLTRKRILIAPSEKPFKRLGKGTVNRWDTMAAYHDEIAALENDG
jgi:hypothetical protein